MIIDKVFGEFLVHFGFVKNNLIAAITVVVNFFFFLPKALVKTFPVKLDVFNYLTVTLTGSGAN